MAPATTIIDVCRDPELFAGWFRDSATWRSWFVFLRALFGLRLSLSDLELYKQCTGRDDLPNGGVREAWLICGRRAGKSFVLALIAVFLACFCDWRGSHKMDRRAPQACCRPRTKQSAPAA
jgi:hypothetical protein